MIMMSLDEAQFSTKNWGDACFGEEINNSQLERIDRFVEESIELAQAMYAKLGYKPEEIKYRITKQTEHTLSRPVGEVEQEIGGVMITLLCLCNAIRVSLIDLTIRELNRCWNNIPKIREKQKSKANEVFGEKGEKG